MLKQLKKEKLTELYIMIQIKMYSRQKHVKQFNRKWQSLFYHLLTTLHYSIQKVYNYLMETHECIFVYDVYLAWTNGQIIL